MQDDRYLIWSHEHSGWWGPAECGYITNISRAGVYTRERACQIVHNALAGSREVPNELPVRVQDLKDAGVLPPTI